MRQLTPTKVCAYTNHTILSEAQVAACIFREGCSAVSLIIKELDKRVKANIQKDPESSDY